MCLQAKGGKFITLFYVENDLQTFVFSTVHNIGNFETIGNDLAWNDDNTYEEQQKQQSFSQNYESEDEMKYNIYEAETEERESKSLLDKQLGIPSKTTNSEDRLTILREIDARQDQRIDQIRFLASNNEDENELFFASMAKIVKKLPKSIQAKLRMDIGNLIGNAEIEFLTSGNSQPLSTESCSTSSFRHVTERKH